MMCEGVAATTGAAECMGSTSRLHVEARKISQVDASPTIRDNVDGVTTQFGALVVRVAGQLIFNERGSDMKRAKR